MLACVVVQVVRNLLQPEKAEFLQATAHRAQQFAVQYLSAEARRLYWVSGWAVDGLGGMLEEGGGSLLVRCTVHTIYRTIPVIHT